MIKWLFAFFTGVFVSALAYAQEQITVYSYHKMPPYIIQQDKQDGLYFDFVTLLNKHQNSVQFSLVYVPRKRLNLMLETNSLDGVIIGVNPVWFGDNNKQKYLWSEAFMSDRDDYVSNAQKPFEYEKESSLYNKQVGGIHGFKYPNIDKLAERGLLTRVNTDSETQLVAMVIKQRVDVAIVSELTTNYFAKIYDWQEQLATSHIPQYQFDRAFLVPKDKANILALLNNQLSSSAFLSDWQVKISQYKTTATQAQQHQ